MDNKSGTGRVALITGGAGFVGSNLAERLLTEPGVQVRVFDNLSRAGVKHNVEFLRSLPGSDRLRIITGDIRDAIAVQRAARDVTEIYHLAAQVAVTTSVADPVSDFEVNAQGTVNVLEAARLSGTNPFFLFTSTNKVYGSLHGVPVEIAGSRYRATSAQFLGVDESEALDFHSPYGCSKGAADQYVRDYARIYNLPSVVFRMSCIAGPRQFGNEDQGWVAHFFYSMLSDAPVTVYGDGLQVRDLLHVHDLVDAMLAARSNAAATQGEIYNIGGGPNQTSSVIEMLQQIESKTGARLRLEKSGVRPGDQPLFISDTRKFERHTAWKATRSVDRILDDIYAFWRNNKNVIAMNAAAAKSVLELVAEEVA